MEDSGSLGRKGKGRTKATLVALAPTDDLELDDRWGDSAVRAPPPGLATKAEPPAPAAATGTTEVNSGTTTKAPELGYKDTLLRLSWDATVVNTLDDSLNSEKGKLATFDGKVWAVLMTSGPKRNQIVYLPSRNLEGCGETLPT